MTAPSPADAFRAYYVKVLDLEGRLGSEAPTPGERLTLDQVQSELEGLVEPLDSEDRSVAERVQLAMAVFADHRFTRLDWAQADEWRRRSLEARLFQTNEGRAGLYRQIEKLLEVGDPAFRHLAKVYLLALTLGLSEGLENRTLEEKVAGYERDLLSFVTGKSAGEGPRQFVSPSAYEHTAGRPPSSRLAPVRRWAWLALGAVLVLFAGSYLIWSDATADLAASIDRLLTGGGGSR